MRHDGNYTTYLWVRICLAFVEIATPFYALYAIDALGIKTSLVGTYLSMMTFAAFVANPFWGGWGEAWLSRRAAPILLIGDHCSPAGHRLAADRGRRQGKRMRPCLPTSMAWSSW